MGRDKISLICHLRSRAMLMKMAVSIHEVRTRIITAVKALFNVVTCLYVPELVLS